jgi:two-component system NtrC family response regulator
MISGHATVEKVITAWNQGALMFLEKPYSLEEMEKAVKRAEYYSRGFSRLHQLEAQVISQKMEQSLGTKVIAKSPQMKKCLSLAKKYAQNNHSVLITGESGTGKEIVAKLIHYFSNRSEEEFVAVNVNAIPHELFESTLFGYVKGAFTGANTNTTGLVEKAGKGTIFLDEIGDLPMEQQVKLLRLIETREYYKVGSSRPSRTEARFIFVTMQDLNQKVEQQSFRNDLFYRISDLEINIPPLRERKEDISALCEYIIPQLAKEEGIAKIPVLTKDAYKAILTYSFPGNIRELKKILRKAILNLESNEILKEDLFPPVEQNVAKTKGTFCPDCEAYFIKKVLTNTDFNASLTMKLLGISRSSFYDKLKRYNINVKHNIEE